MLLTTPAPHGEAMLWKLEYLFNEREADEEEGGIFAPSYSMDWIGPLMADARRLLGRGGTAVEAGKERPRR